MSCYHYNNFQHPPPGWYADPTTVNRSSSGPDFTFPGHGFQSTYPPQINHCFVPQYYSTAPQTPPYPPQINHCFVPQYYSTAPQTPPYHPSSMFYNTVHQPAAFITNPPSYPFQLHGTEQYDYSFQPDTIGFPASSNHCVASRNTQYSNVTEKTTPEGDIHHSQHTHAETYTIHKTQCSQQQDQQRIGKQEQKIREKDGQTSLQQPQWRRQHHKQYNPNKQHNQSMKEKELGNKNAPQSGYKQWNKNSYINEDRELNLPIKNQEQQTYEEEKQKSLRQTQPWRQHQEQHNLDQRQDNGVREKQQGIPKAHQRSHQQWNKQSDIKEGRGLNAPKAPSQCRTYSNSNNNSVNSFTKPINITHSRRPVSKHEQDIARAVPAQCKAKEGEIITKVYTSNAISRNHNVSLNQPSLNSVTKKCKNRTKSSITGYEITDSSSPITEFTDLRLNSTDVILDEYHSDLNAVVGREGGDMSTLNTPVCFRLLYAGSKANYGVSKGRVFFEAKVTHNLLSYSSVSWDECQTNAARFGWSEEKASLELGEESMSFGYSSSGKFATNDIYRHYGEPFTLNDVIGALIDLDSTPATISFMKNGTSFGIAESISTHCVNDKQQVVMFPHVYIKNCKISINFGQEKPWFPPPEGYRYISHLQPYERVNSIKPDSRAQGEVIMLIGLPGAGKTTWAKKQQQENPGKQYYILGTDQLLDKMRTTELPRGPYSERFHKLYDTANECFEVLLDIAARRSRNCILDQTNVVDRARERKMTRFSGFYRIAVVIQPCVQELERRSQERTKKFGKRVPLQTLSHMKEKYSLPSRPFFHEIKYPELAERQVRDLVIQYNRVGS